jgi:hypothetical protein
LLPNLGKRPTAKGSRNIGSEFAVAADDLYRSTFPRVLLIPQGVVEIEDASIEGAAVWFETHIGTGETRSLPLGRFVILGARTE